MHRFALPCLCGLALALVGACGGASPDAFPGPAGGSHPGGSGSSGGSNGGSSSGVTGSSGGSSGMTMGGWPVVRGHGRELERWEQRRQQRRRRGRQRGRRREPGRAAQRERCLDSDARLQGRHPHDDLYDGRIVLRLDGVHRNRRDLPGRRLHVHGHDRSLRQYRRLPRDAGLLRDRHDHRDHHDVLGRLVRHDLPCGGGCVSGPLPALRSTRQRLPVVEDLHDEHRPYRLQRLSLKHLLDRVEALGWRVAERARQRQLGGRRRDVERDGARELRA